MPCYSLLIRGTFDPPMRSGISERDLQGFYASRCLFARNEQLAIQRAFADVRTRLAEQNDGVRSGAISVRLHAEEMGRAPFWSVLRASNRSFIFY